MIRPIHALLFAAALGCLAPLAARADDADVVRAVVGSEAEAKGDFDAWLTELVAAVEANPDSPATAAALSKIQALVGGATDPTIVEKRLEPVLAKGVRDGEVDEQLRDVLAGRARARGEFEKAAAFGAERGYLRRFAAIGPFGWNNGALVHRRYPPQAHDLDLSASMPGQWGPVRWLALPVLGTDAWVTPSSQLRPSGDAVFYAIARLRSDKTRTVALKIACRDSFAVFVNGAQAALADRAHDAVPSEVWTTVRLESGWNRLLVKVAGGASFAVKICDPTTALPVVDVEAGDPLAGAEIATSTGAPDALAYKSPFERAAAASTKDFAASAVVGYLAGSAGRKWDAYEAYRTAVAAPGADATGATAANVHAAYGRFLATFDEFPEVHRKLRAKEQFAAAVKAFPRHNSAAVRLAEYENEDDHPDKAVKALREQIQALPTATAWMSLASIAKRRGWEREAIDAANAALKISPNNAGAVEFLLEFDRRYGNAASGAAKVERLLAIDAANGVGVRDSLTELRAQGKHEQALVLARTYAARWPDSMPWRVHVAQLLQALGRDDEALAAWRDLAALVPLEASYPKAIGQMLESKGDKAGALAAFQKSLALDPFQPPAWRDVARLSGADADFGAPFEPNVDELLAKLPSTEELKAKYPKAVAVTVLDHCVTRVRADGCAQSYVHMVFKILDANGVKKYNDVANRGELLEVRAILPDGSVKTPTGIPGRAFNMEGLVPGAVVEHRYLESQRTSPKGYDGGMFYFQDSEFRDEPNPVMLSRFVVISPEGLKLDPVKHNYDGDPKVETKDGLTTTIWEKREMPRIEPEKLMPQADEIIPYVDYSREQDDEDANWVFLGQRDDTIPTPMLAEVVARVCTDGASDMDKLRALYDFVNDEITGDNGGREGPSAILLEKSGDREQLFAALARTAGVPFRLGRAMPWRGETASEPPRRVPLATRFSESFLWFEPRGAEPFPFFMLSRYAPFGIVPESFRGSPAFVVDERGGSIQRLPDGGTPTQDYTRFEIRLGVDEASTKLSGAIAYRGAEDYEAKHTIVEWSQDERRKWVERTLTSYFATPTVESFDLPDIGKRAVPFELRVEATMGTYLTAQGDGYVAPLGLPRVNMTSRFVDRQDRTYDVVANGVHEDRLDQFTVVLGGAFRLKTLPQSHVVASRLGTYSLTWVDKGDRIEVRREMHLHPARFRADEYRELVAWCKGIDDAEERKFEFLKTK